jgi:hypothetical protein
VCGVVVVFIRIAIRIRKGGGSLTTLTLGATDAFLIKDRQKAAEMIVERNAGKKLDEQFSGEKEEPGEGEPLSSQEPDTKSR